MFTFHENTAFTFTLLVFKELNLNSTCRDQITNFRVFYYLLLTFCDLSLQDKSFSHSNYPLLILSAFVSLRA